MRAVTFDKLGLRPTDHFVDVGSCTDSVTIEAARRVERVTAVRCKPDRLDVTRGNLAANDYNVDMMLREVKASDGSSADADAMLVGGSRNFEAMLDHAVETGVDWIVMNVSRAESAGDVVEAFRERDLLLAVVQPQVSRGCELAGATSFRSDNSVYVVVGRRDAEGL